MRASFLLFCFFCCHHFATSQSTPDSKEAAAAYYYYPHFATSTIHFKKGQTSKTYLNYNLALKEMHFINQKGDTLALSNEETIEFIIIKNDTFYYDNGYLKIIEGFHDFKLASKLASEASQKKIRGAYGEDISGTGAVGISHVTSNNYGTAKINANEGSYRNFAVSYYISNGKNSFIPLTNKTILQRFDKHRKQVASFISTNAIDFTVEADIKKLLTFATQLQ